MCGIAGIVNLAQKVNLDELGEFTDALAHRGPDGRGLHIEDGSFGLGHRRLAVLDLSQNSGCPFEYLAPNGKRYILTYNGEIYNFIEVRNTLVRLGHSFRTDTDTEVIAAAFAEWGVSCQNQFNGMWAFAILDCTARQLYLCRDRFGVKPLYYSVQANSLYFASEIKAFLKLRNFRLELNEQIVSKYLANSQAVEGTTDQTLIDRLNKVMPGSTVTLKQTGEIQSLRWWSTVPNIQPETNSYDYRQAEFRSLFLDSCLIRLRSDVPIACSFSGGIDSTAVASTINYLRRTHGSIERDAGNPLTGFLSSFPGEPNDETSIARTAAAKIGLNLVESSLLSSYGLEDLFQSVWIMEDVYPAIATPVIENYKKISSHGVKVSIDGHGGDELLGGYGFYLDFPTKNLNNLLYSQFHFSLLPSILRNYDRCSMANGVEVRMPFMDYRLVKQAFSLPPEDKIGGSFTKKILRDSLKGIMPETVRTRRRKIGFNAPMPKIFNESMFNLMNIIFSTSFWKENKWWDGKQIGSYALNKSKNAAWTIEDWSELLDLWLKINLTMWHYIFIEKQYHKFQV